jgi:hypothetical protein
MLVSEEEEEEPSAAGLEELSVQMGKGQGQIFSSLTGNQGQDS